MLSHTDVIRELGGPAKIAKAIGIRPDRAIHWPTRGIPAKYWPEVAAMDVAQEKGITALLLRQLQQSAEAA